MGSGAGWALARGSKERSDMKIVKARNEKARRCGDADDQRDILLSLRGEVEIFTPGLELYFTSGFIGGAGEHLRDQPKVSWRESPMVRVA